MTDGWRGKRVLVTGAAGFIGSHLTSRLLDEGAEVSAFVRYNSRADIGRLRELEPDKREAVDVFFGDLGNPDAAASAASGRDAIFHLGALIPIPYSYRHPREYLTANVEGTLNVLEAARRQEVARVVHVSTSEVYGQTTDLPIAETHELRAQSPYAATKIAADQLAASYWASFDVPVVTARPFNTYGPRQSARAVIPAVVIQALQQRVIALGVTTATRDFVFVEDTVSGLLRCGEVDAALGEVINLGTGRETSIEELARIVAGVVGEEKPIELDTGRVRPEKSEIDRLLADTSKAERLLGWRAQVQIEDGVARTVDWFRGELDAYDPSGYVL